MSFSPPKKIHRTSDNISLTYTGISVVNKVTFYNYTYDNGILINESVSYTEEEIIKQLNNYWK